MVAATLLREPRSFPVLLTCPECARPFADEVRCICTTQRLEWWHGLPRTLFGQAYWGETSRENMHQLLDLLDTTPWRDALRRVAGNEPVYRHLMEEIGTDFVYSMPWDKIRTVLEIGSGMGFMTAPLAKFAAKVVAVEAVPERALFLAQRARQDGLDNIYPVIASGTALPFAPEAFDLVAMNGVFEYIGLWGEGNPQQLQQQFLEKVHRLLKPGGYFYIGIETRFGLGNWLGARDHSGMRFTSLMPRWLADWYCRRRKVPFYGSQTHLDGYRTYTYTPRQYAKMMRQAGFATVNVFGCFDGYNRQIGIAPLDDYAAWKATRNIVDPPCSLAGSLRRLIGNNRLGYQALENEVVVFGCKKADAGRLFWSGLHSPGAVTQLNTGKKVSTLFFENGRPQVIAKAAKSRADHRRLAHKYELLHRAQKLLGGEIGGYQVRWPKPLGKQRCHDLEFFEWEFAAGDLLSKLLLPRNYRPRRFARLLKQLTQGYLHMMDRLTSVLSPSSAQAWPRLLEKWSSIRLGDRALEERLQASCRKLAGRDWKLQVMHGDLTFNNVILMKNGQMILVDWENVTEEGLPAIDLFRLLYDAWMDRKVFRPRRAPQFVANVRSAVVDALTSHGIAPADLADLEMLFIAHQHEFDHSRKCDVEILIRAYSDPSFTLLA
jgi:SAM-dependent methyltransferase/thiamine kinase-like enzyme